MPKRVGDKDIKPIIAIDGFVEALKSARKDAGLTQPQAAELANTSAKTISLYETGKSLPTVRALRALSQVYKKPIEEFLPLLGLGINEKDEIHPIKLPPIEEVRKTIADNSHRLKDEDIEQIENFIDFVLDKSGKGKKH